LAAWFWLLFSVQALLQLWFMSWGRGWQESRNDIAAFGCSFLAQIEKVWLFCTFFYLTVPPATHNRTTLWGCRMRTFSDRRWACPVDWTSLTMSSLQ
jgi:hypothetical protein